MPEDNSEKTDEIERITLIDTESEDYQEEEQPGHDPYNSAPAVDKTDEGKG